MIGDASFVGLVRITILRIVVFDDLNVDPLLMMSSIMIGPTVRFFTSLFLPLEKPFGFFSCWECFIVWMSLQLWLAFFSLLFFFNLQFSCDRTWESGIVCSNTRVY